MELYVEWVTQNPILSAFIQFAILGTLGEFCTAIIKNKKLTLFCTWWQLLLKSICWGVLGIFIKYGFTGMKGFVKGLNEHNMLPDFFFTGFGLAFITSLCLQLFFGPHIMFLHRIFDNLILKKWDFRGMKNALLTLLWFWVAAHTFTFMMPPVYQIGLAALWSVVLGIIMGITAPKHNEIK